MQALERKDTRPGPKDFIHFSYTSQGRIAQDNVFAVGGRRAEALYHRFASVNSTTSQKVDAAHKFMAMFGFHPQEIRDIIRYTNSRI